MTIDCGECIKEKICKSALKYMWGFCHEGIPAPQEKTEGEKK